MDVTLPEHVEALRQEVRKFAEKEIRPHVMAWDEAKTFPMAVVKQLGEMGMMGVIFPEEYGGAGMGYLEYAVVVEELSRVDGCVGITVAAHNSLCSNHIFTMGDERQKQAYLKPLASGKAIGAWGLTEPGSGSDAGCPAHRREEGGLALRPERHQDLHHPRHRGRHLRGHGAHPAARPAAAAPTASAPSSLEKGMNGLPRRQAGEQAGPARQRHLRADPRGRARCPRPTCWARTAWASSRP